MKPTQFNIGDTVEILPREGSDFDYYPRYVDSMMEYAGKTARITKLASDGYLLDIDGEWWDWPAEALRKVYNKFKDGDYVCVPSKCYIAIFKETESKTNLSETEASNAHPVKEINYFPTKKHYKFKFNL